MAFSASGNKQETPAGPKSGKIDGRFATRRQVCSG
jgi:hypothetical protein